MAQQPLRHSPSPYGDESVFRKLQASEMERQRLLTELRNLSVQSDAEISSLRETNGCLRKELDKLHKRCCGLEEENTRMVQIAAEWQKFGRYTSTVMQNEVDVPISF
jgi:FtsZ-binding cell division protein ZapB